MPNIKDIFNQSELALASYASLVSGTLISQITSLRQNGEGMATTQATEFVNRYTEVITQFTDPSGFSATVFLSSDNQLTLAIRGTDDIGGLDGLNGSDIDDDINIATNGLATEQLLVMYNWWQRVNYPAGQDVAQYSIASYSDGSLGTPIAGSKLWYSAGGVDFYFEPSTAKATGEIAEAIAKTGDNQLDVTGHSLGGYLSLAFSGLFAGDVESTTVFNAPGFINDTRSQNFFTALGGGFPSGINTTNVIADEASIGDVPFNAIAGLNSRIGTHVNISIEDQSGSDEVNPPLARNHSKQILTDSLAVLSIIAQLDNNFSESEYKQLLGASALGTSASYERIIDALQEWLGIDNTLLPTGNSERETLYIAINELQDSFEDENLLLVNATDITLLSGNTVEIALQDTDDGRAYRFALVHALPFAITTGVANTAAASSDYDLANYSEQYLPDRAQYLSTLLSINTNDFQLQETLTIAGDLDITIDNNGQSFAEVDLKVDLNQNSFFSVEAAEQQTVSTGSKRTYTIFTTRIAQRSSSFLCMSKETNQRKHIPQSSLSGSLTFDKKKRSALCHLQVAKRLKSTSCCLNPLFISTLGLMKGKQAA
jgi:pimeloyl-ACP methyl ester carboxylesterase